jgi:branched-subunit amino acid aminotransferase/4-amino-4-deoxychorismate lyase
MERYLVTPAPTLTLIVDFFKLLEAFTAGTAATIGPVKGLGYEEQEIRLPTRSEAGPLTSALSKPLFDIHYGQTDSPWSVLL